MTHHDEHLSPLALEILRDADRAYEPGALDKQRTRARLARAMVGSAPLAQSSSAPASDSSAPTAGALRGATSAGALDSGLSVVSSATRKWVATIGILSAGLSAGYVTGRLHGASMSDPVAVSTLAPPSTQSVNKPGREVEQKRPPGPQTKPTADDLEISPSSPQGARRDDGKDSETRQRDSSAPDTVSSEETGEPMNAALAKSPMSQLMEEANLLRLAQQALHEGNSYRARDLLDQGDHSFPRGALVQDRAAARVLLLCSMGFVADARVAAVAFFDRYPQSVHRRRIESSCAARPSEREILR